MQINSYSISILLIILFAMLFTACDRQTPLSLQTDEVSALAHEFRQAEKTLLDTWYPRVVDKEDGGYLTDFNADWALAGPQRKMIVTQARHVWTASQAAMRYPENPVFLEVAQHGYIFLRDVMWDNTQGGFFTMVSKEGEPDLEGSNAMKTAYGNAFGIYALAAYAKASGDDEALTFAKTAFEWLDGHSHDTEYPGYFQFLDQSGSPLIHGYGNTPPKDQNSSIHLLEAFTALYDVWPDEVVRQRLEEMLLLVRDTMVLDNKYLQLFFQRDLQPLSYQDSSAAVREANYNLDHVSVGHDVETAFLMLEAVHALNLPAQETALAGKSMVDHALQVGWDHQAGGFYDYVYYLPGNTSATVIGDTKNWWAQAEGLNTLLLMHTQYPHDAHNYFDKFKQQWAFSKTYLIDHERGGWYSGSLDKQPEKVHEAKSQIWKGSYHTVRSLMHCTDMLEKLGEVKS